VGVHGEHLHHDAGHGGPPPSRQLPPRRKPGPDHAGDQVAPGGAISRDYWLGQWDLEDEATDPYGGLALVAENAWAEQYAGGVGDYVDPAIPEADYAKLRSAASKVNQFANRHIAHSPATIHQPDLQRPPDVEPASAEDETLSAKEVHEVIDVIGDLFKKYYNLLTASSYVFLEPVIQHDWLAPFRVPWMKPGYEPED
jgi:hypothetical protein